MNLEPYLKAGQFIDSGHADVEAFACKITAGSADGISRAIRLYYAVRDDITYDPYYVGDARSYFRASDCLRAKRGFCIPKAALLAASARSMGIPARVAYADVRNHLSSKKLIELLGTDLFIWHGFTELYLEGRWVKLPPPLTLAFASASAYIRWSSTGGTIRSSRSMITGVAASWSTSGNAVITLTCHTTQSSRNSRACTPAGWLW